MKNDKPHGQWMCLHALLALPPFGVTANQVLDCVIMTGSGVRTRLKELEDMGLVVSRDREGDHRIYWITAMGRKVARSGARGELVLSIMRNTHAAMEQERAVELAPIKEKWDERIRSQMRMHAVALICPQLHQ